MREKLIFEFTRKGEKVKRESLGIPNSLEKIHISVKKPEDVNGGGYLAVFDECGNLRFQKMLSYGEQELGVGEQPKDTSVGGVTGRIGAGNWTFMCGFMFGDPVESEEDKSVEIELTISDEAIPLTEALDEAWMTSEDGNRINEKLFDWGKIYSNKTTWFKGDFHTHTRLSDGKETVENAMKKAVDMKLDFYVPTEHNLIHTGWKKTELLIVPGVEITDGLGHFNMFGITERPVGIDGMMMASTLEEKKKQLLSMIEEAVEKQWIVSINHPFLHVWKWHLDEVKLDKIQCLEIINDPTYTYAIEANDRAISFLDALWLDGHKIYGVGGSDAHNLIDERYEGATEPSIAGDPGTYVHCPKLSAEQLLTNVRKGHMIVTRYCEVVPHIYSDTREYLPGDEIIDREITYAVEISGITEYPRVCLIGNSKEDTLRRIPLQVVKKSGGKFVAEQKFKMEQGSWRWIRMEIRDESGKFLGYVNPVYTGQKESQYHTYGEVKAVWESKKNAN